MAISAAPRSPSSSLLPQQQQQPPHASSSSTTTPASGASSMTATERDPDPEAAAAAADADRNDASHFRLVFRPSGVSPAVLAHHYHGKGTEADPFVVDFLPIDAHNPFRFPRWKKWFITLLQAFATLAVAFVSTAYSGGVFEVMSLFGVGDEIAILGISLFVVGFAVGPLLWAPLSEFYGRQILFFSTYMLLTAFNAGAAGAQNIQTLIILRFLAGAFGSSPLTNSGGVIADMFAADERGLATAIFAAAPFLGPSIGPIVGGFLGEARGFRWIEGLMAIFTGALWLVCSLLVPETYAPVLLRKRAAELSRRTGRVYISKMDVGNRKTMATQFRIALLRPWILLFREPIVLLTALYMAVIYGTLYMMFPAFPIVFTEYRGWSLGIGGLAFLGVAVGMSAGVGYAIYDNRRYGAVVKAHDGLAPPEARLPPGIVGAVLLPVGLFWFAWTNGPDIHWIVPIVASGFFALGLVLVFLSLMNYLIDSYVLYAASVLAANAVIRSLFGAAFPLFTTQMYANLGLHWASSVPAFLALACVPMPLLFYRYGAAIRARCKFAAEAAEVLAVMRGQVQRDQSGEADEEEFEDIERRRSSVGMSRVESRASRVSAPPPREKPARKQPENDDEEEGHETERTVTDEKTDNESEKPQVKTEDS